MLPVEPGGDRAAAELSQGLTRTSRSPVRGRRARWPAPGRGCCGNARSARLCGRRSRAMAKNSPTWRGFAIPVVSPKATSAQPAVAQPLGDLEHALGRHLALVGAAEAGRDHTLAAQARRALARSITRSRPASESAIERLTLRWLCVSEAERNRLTSSKRSRLSERSARARARSGSGPSRRPPPGARHRLEHLLGVGELRESHRRERRR